MLGVARKKISERIADDADQNNDENGNQNRISKYFQVELIRKNRDIIIETDRQRPCHALVGIQAFLKKNK